MSLRERYQSVLQRMQKRIDDASYEWHMTGSATARKEYYQLIFEVLIDIFHGETYISPLSSWYSCVSSRSIVFIL